MEYAAVVQVICVNEEYSWKQARWTLYTGDLNAARVFDPNPGVESISLTVESKELEKMKKELGEIQGKYVSLKGHRRLANQRKQERNFVQSAEECVRILDEWTDGDQDCHYLASTALELVNKAGSHGWETTGQIPGYPGPTGITMMRRRIE